MYSTIKLIYGNCVLGRRSIDLRTGAWTTTWAELLWTSFSESLWWQPSATSLHCTVNWRGWMKCPTQWASILRFWSMCLAIVWPIQTIFKPIITHVSSTTIQLNVLNSSCNSLHSGNRCCMLQWTNSVKLRNIPTQRSNQATGCWMNRYFSGNWS